MANTITWGGDLFATTKGGSVIKIVDESGNIDLANMGITRNSNKTIYLKDGTIKTIGPYEPAVNYNGSEFVFNNEPEQTNLISWSENLTTYTSTTTTNALSDIDSPRGDKTVFKVTEDALNTVLSPLGESISLKAFVVCWVCLVLV